MQYKQIVTGYFLERPNRFIAHVEVDGEKKICHVKNTGRCRELLTPRAKVILARGENPNRKTEYDLIAVYKGDRLINLDSQAPNAVFGEWVRRSEYFSELTFVKPEYTSLSEGKIRERASLIAGDTPLPPPTKAKGDRLTDVLKILLGTFCGLAAGLAIACLIK